MNTNLVCKKKRGYLCINVLHIYIYFPILPNGQGKRHPPNGIRVELSKSSIPTIFKLDCDLIFKIEILIWDHKMTIMQRCWCCPHAS